MSATKEIRRQTLDGITPLRHHSMNQTNLNESFQGAKHFEPSKKVVRSRRNSEKMSYDEKKIARVLARVVAKAHGYDDETPQVTNRETLFLLVNNIPVQDYIDGKLSLPMKLEIKNL